MNIVIAPPPEQPDEKHFNINQQALEFLRRASDGNGLTPDQITLVQQTTEVHRLEGRLTIELTPRVAESLRKGRVPYGLTLGSKQAILEYIEGIEPDFLKSPELQRRILDQLSAIPGQGWGLEDIKIPLPEIQKEFSCIDKCLKCAGLTKVNCITCNTACTIPCPNCQAQGMVPCVLCRGSGRLAQSDGTQSQCQKCNGQGRMFCPSCQNARHLPCPTCTGAGFIGCAECDQSGYWTHIYASTYAAHIYFILDKNTLTPEIQEVLDKLQVMRLSIEGHVELFYSPHILEGKQLIYPLTALLPVCQAEFSIAGKAYPATIVGLHSALVVMEAFLDGFLKPGITALLALTKNPVTPQPLIDEACRFRLLREILADLTHHSAHAVYKKCLNDYPSILSEKYARAAVKYAEQALLALGKKLRIIGLLVGTLISLGLSALYDFSSLRTEIMQLLAQKKIAPVIFISDGLVCLIGYLITLYIIKLMATRSLRRFLPDLIQAQPHSLSPAGIQGYYAVITTVLAFLAVHALNMRL